MTDPARRSRGDHVAGPQGDDREDVGDQRRRGEDEVAGVGRLHAVAVDVGGEVESGAGLGMAAPSSRTDVESIRAFAPVVLQAADLVHQRLRSPA